MKRTLLLFVLAVTTAGCGLADTEINEIGLIYTGGLIEDRAYKGLLEPGANNNQVGYGSEVYRYRTDQRSYIAGTREGADTAPVEVVSEDDVRLAVEYQLYFKLNRDEPVLRRFHENLGVKTQAWTPAGWTELLRTYFEPQIERALEAAALQHPWRDLYASEEARVAFQGLTVRNLKDNIREVIGDDYFCGPAYAGPGSQCGDFTFTVGKPTPTNTGIVDAVEREQTAVAATIAQQQETQRVQAELEAELLTVELYGPQGALLREAIRSGQVQLMVVPQGSDITVPSSAVGGAGTVVPQDAGSAAGADAGADAGGG